MLYLAETFWPALLVALLIGIAVGWLTTSR